MLSPPHPADTAETATHPFVHVRPPVARRGWVARWAAYGLAAGCALGGVGVAHAGQAQKAVEAMRRAAMKDDIATLNAHVDYRAVAQAALDESWKDFSKTERRQFLRDFQTLVQRAYVKGLGGKEKHPLRFGGETQRAELSIVHTHVRLKPNEPELAIDYAMACGAKLCQLRDVVTDGSSLVDAWRRMFRRIIKKQGKAELLRRIAKKAAQPDPSEKGAG